MRMRNWTELAVGMCRAKRIVTVVRMLTVVSMEREQQEEDDYNFALALQVQEMWEEDGEASAAACIETPPDPASLSPLSVVDEAWELLDPNPDVRALFVQFNEAFFWGQLSAVEVSWSPRMTLYGREGEEGRGERGGGRRGWEPAGAAAGVVPPPLLLGLLGHPRGCRAVNSQLASRIVKACRCHCFVLGSLSAAPGCVNMKETVGCVLFV